MPWDDLHEPKGPEDRFKGGGGSPQKPPFEIPQLKIPQFKPSMILGIILLLLLVWIVPGTFYFVEPDEEGILLVSIFGEQKFIKGYIHSLSLVDHKIYIQQSI